MKERAAFHRLILIYGPGSGLGKSTLAKELAEQFQVQKRLVCLIHEDEVALRAEFANYVQQVENDRAGDAKTLLNCCQAFIQNIDKTDADIIVLDSILPCWDWLFTADCSLDTVAEFSQRLCALIATLRPLLVFVEGNQEAALSRAIADRGEVWALNLATERTGESGSGRLVEYFRHLRESANEMITLWSHDVIRVDTVESSITDVIRKILDKIDSSNQNHAG